MGAHLDKVLSLGRVGGYERFEHGHEERVGGYERVLRDLTGGAPGEGLGRLREQDFPAAVEDMEARLRPAEERLIKGHLDHAHLAFHSQDYALAHVHLTQAKDVAAQSDYNAGSLRRVLTEAQVNMVQKLDALKKEAPKLPDWVTGDSPHTNTGPGGIIRRGEGALSPPQVDLAEPVVRFLERRQARREAKARKPKPPKPPKLPRLV